MSAIVGIGLDVVDLARFQGVLERHGEAFTRRIFREGEIRPSAGSARVAHLGGLFAAKEAAMKALGTGWALGVGFRQVEIARDAAGAPSLRFHDEALRRAEALGVATAHLSITHDGRIAAAVVVLEAAGGKS
ncbi:MAG TPA: holo-ACP synthase [Thermoanaerobaculia bacterium]|nr:holo-ACP synthase [Thermoanaerobaculia bacterium]